MGSITRPIGARKFEIGGPASVIIDRARGGNIRIDISDSILAGAARVLRDKFEWDGNSLQDALGKLLAFPPVMLQGTVPFSIDAGPHRHRPSPSMQGQVGLPAAFAGNGFGPIRNLIAHFDIASYLGYTTEHDYFGLGGRLAKSYAWLAFCEAYQNNR